MFFGRSDHSLDAKGRLFLPARHRPSFERGAFVTKSIDGCLAIWPQDDFLRMIAELQEKARRGAKERQVLRSIAAGTHEVLPDRQGRVPIPQALREFAGLAEQVAVIGNVDHLEVWDPERWAAKDAQGSEGLHDGSDEIADMAF